MFRIQRAAALFDCVGCQTQKVVLVATRNIRNSSCLYQEAAQKKVAEQPAVRGIPYTKLSIGVPKETFLNERRVAIVPATVQALSKKGFTVNVEQNCGVQASFLNQDYEAAGAKIKSVEDVFKSDIVLKVRAPSTAEVEKLVGGNTLISFMYPAQNKDLVDQLTKKNLTVFGMDCVPRISRAQVFDALSSMANIAGYKAVVLAANHFGRFFTGLLMPYFNKSVLFEMFYFVVVID